MTYLGNNNLCLKKILNLSDNHKDLAIPSLLKYNSNILSGGSNNNLKNVTKINNNDLVIEDYFDNLLKNVNQGVNENINKKTNTKKKSKIKSLKNKKTRKQI